MMMFFANGGVFCLFCLGLHPRRRIPEYSQPDHAEHGCSSYVVEPSFPRFLTARGDQRIDNSEKGEGGIL